MGIVRASFSFVTVKMIVVTVVTKEIVKIESVTSKLDNKTNDIFQKFPLLFF